MPDVFLRAATAEDQATIRRIARAARLHPLYLRCASHNEGYYHRFGFCTLLAEDMPRSMRQVYQISNAALPLLNLIAGGHERLLVMGRW